MSQGSLRVSVSVCGKRDVWSQSRSKLGEGEYTVTAAGVRYPVDLVIAWQYTQLVDRNASSRLVNAEFVQETAFGQILTFAEFEWEGERRLVAVIQPCDTQNWLNTPNPPMEILRERGLQVVDVNSIIAPAGRLMMNRGRKVLVFETSDGGMVPEFCDDDSPEEVSSLFHFLDFSHVVRTIPQ